MPIGMRHVIDPNKTNHPTILVQWLPAKLWNNGGLVTVGGRTQAHLQQGLETSTTSRMIEHTNEPVQPNRNPFRNQTRYDHFQQDSMFKEPDT
jgi:hypothetical protein